MDNAVRIAMSSVADGSMSKAASESERIENRQKFLAKQGITPEQTTLVRLAYDGDSYCRYVMVDAHQAGDGITKPTSLISDALFTREKNLALLLPVADCVAAVMYDGENEILGLAHLGRHNLLQQGGSEVIRYMTESFGTNASRVLVWLSASANKHNYPLFDFERKSMHEVAIEQLHKAGIVYENIRRDTRDTTIDPALFSHSEFLKGNRHTDGRQAVIAMMI